MLRNKLASAMQGQIQLVLVLLFTSTMQERTDQTEELLPHEGFWGDWGDWLMCKDGYYASSILAWVEEPQGDGDDTAMNRLEMSCRSLNNEWDTDTGEQIVTQTNGDGGAWGGAGEWGTVYDQNFLSAVSVKIEGDQGGGDDTAMNSIKMSALDGSEIEVNNGGDWGEWTEFSYCPTGDVICGVAARVEGDQDGGDDTALNALTFKCCNILSFEFLSMVFDDMDVSSIAVEPQLLGTKIIANPSNAIAIQAVSISQSFSKSFTYSFSQTLGISSTIEITAGIPDFMEASTSLTLQTSFEEGTSEEVTETVTYEASQEVQAQPYSCIEAQGSISFSTDDVTFPFTAEIKVSPSSGDTSMSEEMVLAILQQKGFTGEVKEVQSDYMLVTIRGELRTGLAYRTTLHTQDVPFDDPKCQQAERIG